MEIYIKQGICALIPAYGENGGNHTRILLVNGEERVEERMVKTVLRDIAAFYQMDVGLIRRKYGELLGIRNGIPLPFTPEQVWVPFKVRQPVGANDGAFAYISFDWIEDAFSPEGKTKIKLRNGVEIPLLESIRCFDTRMKNARIIREQFTAFFCSVQERNMPW